MRLRRCLATWALAAARGVPVRKVLRQRGWSKSTFYRKLDGGAARIAAILGSSAASWCGDRWPSEAGTAA